MAAGSGQSQNPLTTLDWNPGRLSRFPGGPWVAVDSKVKQRPHDLHEERGALAVSALGVPRLLARDPALKGLRDRYVRAIDESSDVGREAMGENGRQRLFGWDATETRRQAKLVNVAKKRIG